MMLDERELLDTPPPPSTTVWGRTRRAFAKPYRVVAPRLARWFFERDLVETEEPSDLEAHGLPKDSVGDYIPSRWTDLRRVLRRSKVKRSDVFVDFGSGTGRVLLQAGRYPFRRVTGIEITTSLNEIARANIKRRKHRFRAEAVEVVEANVLDWNIPDDMTHAWFFDPFERDVMARVVEMLHDSLERQPRDLTVFYAYPRHADLFDRSDVFELVRKSWGIRRGLPWRWIFVYRAMPERGRAHPRH